MARIQSYRLPAIATPLGDDVLLLVRFHGKEQLGRLFEFELDLVSENHTLAFADIVGKNVTIRLSKANGDTRYFNGYVSRFAQVRNPGRLARYKATVSPWFWFLTRTADCRIFQNKTVPTIIKEVFREYGFSDFEDRLSGTYREWEYCVQYRESYFNFISRLMEQEGIYYFFRHENGKHVLVMADSPSAHQPLPGYGEIPYRAPGHAFEPERITDWTVEQAIQPGGFALNDFDFKDPRKSLRTASQITRPHDRAEYEVYDYPGEYVEFNEGEVAAKVRIEELQAQHETFVGESDAHGIAAGSTFKLTEHPRPDQGREYLVTSAIHLFVSDEFDSAGEPAGKVPLYTCRFTALDARQPFRAPRTTPRPLIRGPQTAIVVGKQGEEVWTDEYGRVKVQFHWDRYGKADENASCWIRTAHVWAGKKWGGMYIPRIGQEVIVEFLEGDPDRPLITGRVYNGTAMPPYDLPANKTMSTLKSNSTKGGDGFNEIRLEDKKGSEQIFVHAEKDEDVRVKNDCREWIGRDRHLVVKRDQLELVEGDLHEQVKGDRNEKVDGSISQQTGVDWQHKVGQKQAVEAGTEIHLKAGQKVVIEAGVQLTIKASGGFVDIGPGGVTIVGTMVRINSGGSPGSGSGCSPDSPHTAANADDAGAGFVDDAARPGPPPKPTKYGPQATVMKQAALSAAPFCEKCQEAMARLLALGLETGNNHASG